ncbi:hypothetical protein [Nonomuraea sp. B19D2]|uniref:hypothetical protein n=1 Tax=Nonomuraea sp. B19D2 TaxID=3159561 RepID=UPI0032DACC96
MPHGALDHGVWQRGANLPDTAGESIEAHRAFIARRLAGAQDKLTQLDRGHGQHTAVDLGIPTTRDDR